MARADQRHAPQALGKAAGDFGVECRFRHAGNRIHGVAGQREHYRGAVHAGGWIIVHGQQRQRLAIVEPLPGHVVVRFLVQHAAHQHAVAEVVHVGSQTHGAARAGEAAVGGHQQARVEGAAVFQCHMCSVVVTPHTPGFLAGEQGDVLMRGDAVLHAVPRGLADQVVGDEPAQFAARRQRVADDQTERIGAVQHLCVAQLGEGRRLDLLDPLPQAELAQGVCRPLRKGDFASVEGRMREGFLGLLVQHADAQALARQRPCQTQSGRAGTHNQNVVIHGEAV